jgi:hypothetical protein
MLDFIALLFGKNKKSKKMEITQKTLDDARVMYSNMDFQWIKGDDALSLETFKSINMVDDLAFIEFASGKRINMNLLDEYMTYYPSQPKTPSLVHGRTENSSHIEQPRISTVTEVVYKDQYQSLVDTDSPIYKLLRKQKKNIVEVSIKMKLNLPPKDLYGVLSSSFEDADSEIINFVLDGVDIDDIKASLAESIKKTYYSINKQESVKSTSPVKNAKNLTENE